MRVAVNSSSVCPSCRRFTVDFPLPGPSDDAFESPDQRSATDNSSHFVLRADTNRNHGFRIASLIPACVQVASLVRHAATHHDPSGANPLEGLAPLIELWISVAASLPILVTGSALGLGAGNRSVFCIVINISVWLSCMILASIM